MFIRDTFGSCLQRQQTRLSKHGSRFVMVSIANNDHNALTTDSVDCKSASLTEMQSKLIEHDLEWTTLAVKNNDSMRWSFDERLISWLMISQISFYQPNPKGHYLTFLNITRLFFVPALQSIKLPAFQRARSAITDQMTFWKQTRAVLFTCPEVFNEFVMFDACEFCLQIGSLKCWQACACLLGRCAHTHSIPSTKFTSNRFKLISCVFIDKFASSSLSLLPFTD